MEYVNNHYIPQLILRRFGKTINRYNVDTGEIVVKGSTINAFSAKKIYPEWLEEMLGNLESVIANLIDKKVLNAIDNVTLTRRDIWTIKKFFAVATLRVPDAILSIAKNHESEDALKSQGFIETKIDNETSEQYLHRTLKVILESKSIEDLYKNPFVTYEACKWMALYNFCYVSIWDSTKSKEDFIITDNGMNCEHDKTRFLEFNFDGSVFKNDKDEMLKNGYMLKHLSNAKKESLEEDAYKKVWANMMYVHANYYLFAVSNTRTISLINPFFRLYDDPSALLALKKAPNVWPTLLSREAMKCNAQTYKQHFGYSEDDLFHYQVKDLPLEDVIIINNMMLDRVFRWVGFDDSSKIARSLNVYSMINSRYQRNRYGKLIQYMYSLGSDFPKTKKYSDISDKLTKIVFTNEEMEYVEYFYNLIKHH